MGSDIFLVLPSVAKGGPSPVDDSDNDGCLWSSGPLIRYGVDPESMSRPQRCENEGYNENYFQIWFLPGLVHSLYPLATPSCGLTTVVSIILQLWREG